MKKIAISLITVLSCLFVGAGCDLAQGGWGVGSSHTCVYEKFYYNEDGYWYECECGKRDEENSHTCVYETFCYNENEHWYACECGQRKDVSAHLGGLATWEAAAQCEVCGQSYGEKKTSYVLGDTVRDFIIPLTNGREFSLYETLQNKELVVLNFWATWCAPCKAEFPALQEAYSQYQDRVEVLAVSITDNLDIVREFKAANRLEFLMTAGEETQPALNTMFPDAVIPLTVILDSDGVIIHWRVGNIIDASEWSALFDSLLK